jgi:predicted KAP-like P-loop ATPase
MTASKRVLGYISDHETKVDLLRNEAIAKTIIRLINERKDGSVTIGVHGGWGAGKSSVLEMIQAGFESGGNRDKGRVLCLKFNGWQFQGFEDAKIAVIEGVVTELIANRTFLSKATDEVREVLKHIDWLKVARRAGGLAFNAFTGLPSPDQISDLVSFAVGKLQDPSTFLTTDNAKAVAGELQAVWKQVPEAKSVPEEVREFHKAFAKLMAKADLDRLVVIVDDLDRCLPETAVETLEAIRLFVSLPMTAFVVGADEDMIKYAVRRHFPELPQGEPWSDYPRAYLEKLIQVPFRIPSMGETETHIYVTLLFVGSLVGEDKPEFNGLLATAKALLSKPWEGKTLEEQHVRHALRGVFTEEVKSAYTLAQRIAPVLSRGTKGNPRQVKRFLNSLNLRLQVSEERGFGTAIEPPVLAKIMLAERFLPTAVFEHIAGAAAASSDGKCAELNKLEVAVSAVNGTEKSGGTDPDAVVEDWLTRPDVARWAKIEPKLGAVNLRPYLFVINDIKNYAESDAPLPPKLRALLEKLTAGETAARSAVSQLKQLEQTEVELLVKELRLKIIGSASFANKPDALVGLGEIVHAHPAFELRYVEVLEELPAPRLGMWAASGHDRFLVGQAGKQRAEALFRRWKTEGSPALQTALDTKAKLKTGKA